MTRGLQDPTLTEYLRVLRQYRWLIAMVMVCCAGVALGLSLIQKPSYSAEASVAVRDPNQDLTLLGGTGSINQTPDQIAAAHVPQVTRPPVAAAVSAQLHGSLTPAQLMQSVDVHVDPASELVLIDARAQRGAQAAAIANGFARADASLSTLEARRTFAREASNLAAKIRSFGSTNNATTRLVYIDQLSRLQSLSAVALPVQVSATATPPGSPDSPKPVFDTLIAAVLGLLLGAIIAFGRHALDRRLRHPDEVEEHLGLPLLGYVRNDALGHAGAISNGRGAIGDADLEAFRILRQNLEYLQHDEDARCILVTSAVAEEGKSTVAAGLALASAAAGKRTLLLECDLRKPVLAERMGLAKAPGLADYLTGFAGPEEVVQVVPSTQRAETPDQLDISPNALTAGGCELVCITAGEVPRRPAEMLASDRFRDLLVEVQEAYEVVVIDSSPLLPVVDTLEYVPYTTGIIVCARCDRTTRDQARATRICLERLPAKPAGAVVTGIHHEDGYYGYYSAENYPAGASVA